MNNKILGAMGKVAKNILVVGTLGTVNAILLNTMKSINKDSGELLTQTKNMIRFISV